MEEIDQMDWGRYLRATEAGHIERIEQRRADQLAGKIKATDVTPEEWEQIQANDALLAELKA